LSALSDLLTRTPPKAAYAMIEAGNGDLPTCDVASECVVEMMTIAPRPVSPEVHHEGVT